MVEKYLICWKNTKKHKPSLPYEISVERDAGLRGSEEKPVKKEEA